MKKILAYVSPDKHPSLFDVIVGYDSGADVVVPYGGMSVSEVKDIIYSATFTRHPGDLKATSVFIGGHDIELCWDLMSSIQKTLDELPSGRRVSVTMDPDGAYTTASACVVKLKGGLDGDLAGRQATVLAGTGPVGQIIATLLSWEGCLVKVTSRDIKRARTACSIIEKRYSAKAQPVLASGPGDMKVAVSGSEIVVSAGPEGVMLLPEDIWSSLDVKVLADVNSVPPYGIEGIDPMLDCGSVGRDVLGIGAIAIGRLKMKTHHELVRRLFDEKGVVFDLEKVYSIAESI